MTQLLLIACLELCSESLSPLIRLDSCQACKWSGGSAAHRQLALRLHAGPAEPAEVGWFHKADALWRLWRPSSRPSSPQPSPPQPSQRDTPLSPRVVPCLLIKRFMASHDANTLDAIFARLYPLVGWFRGGGCDKKSRLFITTKTLRFGSATLAVTTSETFVTRF